MKKDITDIQDIKAMVDGFYTKVRKDDLLSEIFISRIQDNWDLHLDKMYRFWQTVVLDEHTYVGSPFLPHAQLQVEFKHFERWLLLFNETVDSMFEGEKASRVKWQGERMAELFQSKIEYYRNNPAKPLI